MQTVGQLLSLPLPAHGGAQVAATAPDKGQSAAPFEREMARAQAGILRPEAPAEAKTSPQAPSEQVPEEEKAAQDAMAILASAILSQGESSPEAPPQAELHLAPEGGIQELAAQAPGLPDADVSILKELAAQAAQTATAIAQGASEAQAGVMDDPGAQGLSPQEAELAARMPSPQDAMIESWDLEREEAPRAQGISSFLENEDVSQAKAPPPQRVEITQLAQSQASADPDGESQEAEEPLADSTRQSDAPSGDLPEQGALFAVRAEPVAATSAQPLQGDAQAAPPPPVEQLAQEAQVQQAMGRTTFTMHLRPENLGEVTVRLTMAGEALTARIFTHTDEARQAINQQVAQLSEAMRAKGIDVRQVEVVSGNMEQASFAQDGRQGQRNAPQQGHRRRGGEAASLSDALDAVQGYENLFYAPGAQEDRRGVEYRA